MWESEKNFIEDLNAMRNCLMFRWMFFIVFEMRMRNIERIFMWFSVYSPNSMPLIKNTHFLTSDRESCGTCITINIENEQLLFNNKAAQMVYSSWPLNSVYRERSIHPHWVIFACVTMTVQMLWDGVSVTILLHTYILFNKN